MNQKILGACFCLPITFSPFFVYTSCSKPYVFSGSGKGKTFDRNYQKYPNTTISKNSVLSSYINNPNFKKMVGQDITYKMNQDWPTCSQDLIFKYKVSVSANGNRLFGDLQITDDQDNLLVGGTIKQLEYTYNYDSTLNQIQIIPTNVIFNSTTREFTVKEEFGKDDPLFDMIIKYRDNKDQQFYFSYEFSYKTSPTERYHLDEVIEYIVITPGYYDNVTVEGL